MLHDVARGASTSQKVQLRNEEHIESADSNGDPWPKISCRTIAPTHGAVLVVVIQQWAELSGTREGPHRIRCTYALWRNRTTQSSRKRQCKRHNGLPLHNAGDCDFEVIRAGLFRHHTSSLSVIPFVAVVAKGAPRACLSTICAAHTVTAIHARATLVRLGVETAATPHTVNSSASGGGFRPRGEGKSDGVSAASVVGSPLD
mmetsp:Transcript_5418/g.16580  ORF Transcript_5418/g.16580 Transcript_5418/m.16580 type:complete len:202 (-) Transcript_5418:3614-4219(-)